MKLLYLLIRLYETALQIQKSNFFVGLHIIGVLRLHNVIGQWPLYNPPNFVLFQRTQIPLPPVNLLCLVGISSLHISFGCKRKQEFPSAPFPGNFYTFSYSVYQHLTPRSSWHNLCCCESVVSVTTLVVCFLRRHHPCPWVPRALGFGEATCLEQFCLKWKVCSPRVAGGENPGSPSVGCDRRVHCSSCQFSVWLSPSQQDLPSLSALFKWHLLYSSPCISCPPPLSFFLHRAYSLTYFYNISTY